MNEQLLILFICLSVVNVINSTANHIITVKCNKWVASISNAFTYGFYTIVLVYTNSDLPLFTKALVVALANLVGVFIVKTIEQKSQKEKLWKIETTVPKQFEQDVDKIEIPHSYVEIGTRHTLFNFYCSTKKETELLKNNLTNYNAKYFVSESKTDLF